MTLSDRRSQILVDRIGTLRAAFRSARQKRPFAIDAIVVFRTICTRSSPCRPEIPTFLVAGVISKDISQDISLWRVSRSSPCGGFWEHTIRSEADFVRHVDYIHFNPVKHRIVTRLRDWPYSSFHRYVRKGLLAHDWAGDTGESEIKFGEPEA